MKVIDEIIDQLSSENVRLTDSLLKAKIVAFKLKNEELKEWIDNEINGYKDGNLPGYRIFQCTVMGTLNNGYQRATNFVVPLSHLDDELQQGITTVYLTQSLATLDDFIRNPDSTKMAIQIPPDHCWALSQGLGGNVHIETARREIDKTQIVQCVTEIRNKLLDFMLNLSEEIDGDEIDLKSNPSLSDTSKSLFNQAIFGDNTTIIVGDKNKQKVSNTILKGNIDALRKELEKINVPAEDITELASVIDSDNPDPEQRVFGDKVKKWVSKMLLKAMGAGWDISIETAGGVLSALISNYYGW